MRTGGSAGSRDGPEPDWVGDAFDDDPDWEFNSAEDDPWDLLSPATRTSSRADAVLDAALATPEGLDLHAKQPRHGKHATLRWILVHLIEEYARHAGHADLIRESIDGATDL